MPRAAKTDDRPADDSLTPYIQEGGTASLEFLRVTFADIPDAERQKVPLQLEEYCRLDPEGMGWIVDRLRKLAG